MFKLLELNALSPLFAYVGPGVGIAFLAALWAVILAIASAIGAILYWPIRSFLKSRKQKKAATSTPQDDQKLLAQTTDPE